MHNDIKDIEVIERAMNRLDELQQPKVSNPPIWVGAVITAAFAVWVAAMILKTGGVL